VGSSSRPACSRPLDAVGALGRYLSEGLLQCFICHSERDWTQPVFRKLDDEDLNALFAYLQAIPPVKHVIDNIDQPTACAMCGGQHPLGRYNRPRENRTFMVTFPDGNACALVTENRRSFFCDGDIDHVTFVRGSTGRVTQAINNNTDIGARIR
jgi:hypothetical protein